MEKHCVKVVLYISILKSLLLLVKIFSPNSPGHLVISCGIFVQIHVVEDVSNAIVCEVLFSCLKLSLVTLSI